MTRELKRNGPNEATVPAAVYAPLVDVVEAEDGLTLFADLPGVKPEGLDVRFHKGELVLHGRVTTVPPGEGRLREEYGVGDYYRAFTIGTEVDAERITAGLKDGVLTVHLPRAEKAKPRRIEVRGS